MINPEEKVPGCPSFAWWEFFVTQQPGFNSDHRGFSQVLLDEFLAEPEVEAYKQNLMILASRLQGARDILKFAIPIDSGYRSKKLNQMVGGVSNSLHLFGKAADPKLTGDKWAKFKKLMENHSGGFGSGNNQLHIDIGPKSRWSY